MDLQDDICLGKNLIAVGGQLCSLVLVTFIRVAGSFPGPGFDQDLQTCLGKGRYSIGDESNLACSRISLPGNSDYHMIYHFSLMYSWMARAAFHSVKAEVSASVDSGPIRVYLVAPDGTEASATVRPGSPGTVLGEAEVFHDNFRVYFEVLEGEAREVKYSVTYEYP